MSGFKKINDAPCGSNFIHIQMKEKFELNKQIDGVDEIRRMILILMDELEIKRNVDINC